MAQITNTKFIADNTIDDTDIRLRNDEALRSHNAAQDGDVILIRANADNKVQLADTNNSIILPDRSSDPTPTAAGEMWFNSTSGIAKIYDGTVVRTVFQSTSISDLAIGNIDNTNSPYSLTVGTDLLLVDTSSGAVTVNMPTASGIEGKKFIIKKISTDTNLITIDGNGSETIDGSLTDFIMMPYGIYELVSDGTNWVTIKRPQNAEEIYVDSGNGYGSTATKIRRFTNTRVDTANGNITYADSAENGASFTVNKSGIYSISRGDNRSGGPSNFGISVNASSLTTSLVSLTYAQGFRGSVTTGSAGYLGHMATTLYLTSGDVVRPHDTNVQNETDGTSYMKIIRIG